MITEGINDADEANIRRYFLSLAHYIHTPQRGACLYHQEKKLVDVGVHN